MLEDRAAQRKNLATDLASVDDSNMRTKQEKILTLEPGERAIFLADVHLGVSPVVAERFSSFLDVLPRDVTIFFLGDFVDVWAEGSKYDYADLYPALPRLCERRTRFLRGNRDFMIGERWKRVTGGLILGDAAEVQCGGMKVICLHGDTLVTGDFRYQAWRRLCRSAAFRSLAAGLDRKAAERLTGGLRAGSKAEVARKEPQSMEIDHTAAAAAMGEAEVLICGHAHRPSRDPLGKGELIVLGAWDEGAESAFWDGREIRFGSPESFTWE